MAKTPNSRVSKLNSLPDKNSFSNCKLKIQWPTFRYRKEESCFTVLNRLKQERRSEINRQKFSDLISKEKSKVYCSHEDPLKKAEINRRRMLQKIKRVYRINLDGLNEHIINEIILKVNLLEKQKREREKRNAEKNFIMMRRLIDEQKYKLRVKKQTFPPRQRKIKFLPCIDEPRSEKEEKIFEGESGEREEENSSNDLGEIKDKFEEEEVQKKSISTCGRVSMEPRASSIIKSDRSCMGEGEEIDFKFVPKTAKCVLREKSLSATPEKIIFENYLKDKVYLQDLKITNMGIETIHCRYLGIAVHTEGEDKFPVGVAVRDSVLLRPGLWCSTKVRLCAPDDTKQLECSIVYETRRKTNPFQHAWFLIPVICYPCKANVKITPLRIMFPAMTWYEAKKTDKKKLFKKFIKLENIGAKSCSCKIVKERKPVSEYGEIDDYQSEENVKEETAEVKESSRKSLNGEDDSEGYRTLSYLEGVNNACLFLDEIFDNIFATFRFVPRYHIELPPQSTQYVEVKFTPEYKGFHHDIYYIQFEDYDVAEQSIELIGSIKSLPIRPQPTVIDLKICTLNSGVYVSSFKVFNDNPTSYTVSVKIPLALRNHCRVSPSTITILGRDFREFVITFYPRVNLKEEAKKFYKADVGLLEFPLYIHPASVTACKYDFIKIYVFAVITDYILELNPPSIDFGTVTTLETVSTKIQLTNHSLAAQEFGFLNLPKGVAVEPNMGFGMILPRETITLDLLYSPQPGTYECDYKGENRAFEIEITSIAEYGGFGEIFESEKESVPVESSLIEESFLKTPTENTEGLGEEEEEEEKEKEKKEENKESEGGTEFEENVELKSESELEEEKCEDDSSIEELELFTMLEKEENKIRNFLKEDRETPSISSFFDKIDLLGTQEELKPEAEEQAVEYHENNSLKENICFREAFRQGMNSIKCKAHVIKPVCQLSETIIQLPATPYTSFSLYRFHIIGSNFSSKTCVCGRLKKSCEGKPNFEAAFEFTHSSPHIKLEPRSGYLRAGECVPITIVFRPEFDPEHLVHEARIQKARDILSDKKLSISKPDTSKGKPKPSLSSTKKGGARESDRVEKVINVTTFDLENTDLFAGQKALLEFVGNSYSEVPVHCVVKVKGCDGRESTEYHDLIFICPITKPKFKYVGLSQEINFGKVLVHTCAHYVLEVQNISLERIQPEMSLLNPIGPFSCLGGLVKRDVDPEHIWRQVITFNPVKARGLEKEFFEIKYGLTTIFLTVTAESYTPEMKFDEFDRKKANFAKGKSAKSKSVLGIDDNRSKSSKVGVIDRSKKGKGVKSREELQSVKSEVIKNLKFGEVK